MIIFLGIIGLIIGGFVYYVLRPVAIGMVVVTIICLILLFIEKRERNAPLKSKQLERMNEYDKRLRNGEVSQLELDDIILTNSLVWNMFCKYYADTEFMFDLLHRQLELEIEKLSTQNNNENNFNLIKKLELRLEENIKQKQEWINENKKAGLYLDYYGNHGTQINE